jgi:hypothetical protein
LMVTGVQTCALPICPQVYVYGTPTADLGSQAWSVTNATASSDIRVTRIGRRVFIDGAITLNGAATAQIGLTIPSAYSADTTNVYKDIGTISQPVGHVRFLDLSTSGVFDTILQLSSATSLLTVSEQAGGTFVQPLGTSATSPFTWNAGDKILIQASWIVAGWADSTQMSDAADTREVSLIAAVPNALTTTDATVVYNTKEKDTHGAYNTSTGQYTVFVPGTLTVTAGVRLQSTTATVNQASVLSIYKNGVIYKFVDAIRTQTTSSFIREMSGSIDIPCVAGDILTVRLSSDFSVSIDLTVPGFNFFMVSKVSGPSAIAASEKVFVEYNTGSGQAMSAAAFTRINYNTKVVDTHGAFNGATGTFTAPRADVYEIEGAYRPASQAAGSQKLFNVFKNGVDHRRLHMDRNYSGGVDDGNAHGATTLYLLQGETVDLRGLLSTAQNLTAGSGDNWITIKSIGGV